MLSEMYTSDIKAPVTILGEEVAGSVTVDLSQHHYEIVG